MRGLKKTLNSSAIFEDVWFILRILQKKPDLILLN